MTVMHMLQFSRDGGPHTTPFFVYESAPMPLEHRRCYGEFCAQDECESKEECALYEQAEGARMGGGDQQPSEPMPLVQGGIRWYLPGAGFWENFKDGLGLGWLVRWLNTPRRTVTDQERGEAWGNFVGWGIVATLAVLAFCLTLA